MRGAARAACPTTPPQRDPDEQARGLMAQLLEYHHREARPVWWAFFDRLEAEPDAADRGRGLRSR